MDKVHQVSMFPKSDNIVQITFFNRRSSWKLYSPKSPGMMTQNVPFSVAKGLVYNCEHHTQKKATQHKVNRIILIERIDLLDFFPSYILKYNTLRTVISINIPTTRIKYTTLLHCDRKQLQWKVTYFVYEVTSKTGIAAFAKLFPEYVVFTNLIPTRFN